MATSDLSDEQIINLLQMLFTNMNNLDKIYYDMFINATPMTLSLERYNEDGVIETYELPNRAKDRSSILQGAGSPEGVQEASAGVFYFDTLASNIYVKVVEGGSTGWVLIRTTSNFRAGEDYLTPTGSAAHLTDFSASGIQGGLLDVSVGGTGRTSLTGIVKGNGINPFSAAIAGTDYVLPDTFVGMLGFFSGYSDFNVPDGWLVANGSYYRKLDYPTLYSVIGDTYNYAGTDYERTDFDTVLYFALPDYRDKYVRGWDSTSGETLGYIQEDGLPNISGYPTGLWYTGGKNESMTGAMYMTSDDTFKDVSDDIVGTNGKQLRFDASRCSSIYNDDVTKINARNVSTLVCIYAGAKSSAVEG